MRSAVCVVIPSALALTFLSVTRKKNDKVWGFPGGKVDPGESNLAAAVRETFEEVGLALDPMMLEPIFSDALPGTGLDDTYWVTTYLWTGPVPPMDSIIAEPGLLTGWSSVATLSSSDTTPFAAYNRHVFAAYHKHLYGEKRL